MPARRCLPGAFFAVIVVVTAYPMILKLALALLLAFVLTACQALPDIPAAIPPADTPAVDVLTAEAQGGWATYENGSAILKIRIPAGWQSYNTTDGIVLTEHIGTAETAGHLQGILVYIFVPRMSRFELPTTEGANIAWAVLKQVVTNPDYVGRALASEPQAFDWDHHDAAYYLLNNRDSTLTLLLAMSLPPNKMIVAHISLPESQAARLRPLLPSLFQSLTINGVLISAEALRHLPDPLVFPTEAASPH